MNALPEVTTDDPSWDAEGATYSVVAPDGDEPDGDSTVDPPARATDAPAPSARPTATRPGADYFGWPGDNGIPQAKDDEPSEPTSADPADLDAWVASVENPLLDVVGSSLKIAQWEAIHRNQISPDEVIMSASSMAI